MSGGSPWLLICCCTNRVEDLPWECLTSVFCPSFTTTQTLTIIFRNATQGWLQAFDARAVAVQGNLIITTPNMHFVPEFHHFEEEDLQAWADGRFGVIDCFQWPQFYDDSFVTLFAFLERRHFHSRIRYIGPGSPLAGMTLSTLAPDKVYGLQSLLKLAEQRVRNYRKDQLDRGQIIYSRLLYLHHAIARLKSHPLTFRDLLIFVTDAQRLFLDIYSYIDWVLIAQPRTTFSVRHEVNLGWMGGFAQSSDICEKLFCAGVPAWYVRASAYIPPKMMVVELVLLTCLDHIIIAMYAEGRKIRPFEVIYRGQGGHNHHTHIRHLYAGTTYQDPESDKSSQPSSSSSRPASGPKLSALGKAPKQKGKQRHRPYFIEARPTQFPEPTLLIGPKFPERLQLYLANWLAARPLVPSVQPQSSKGKEPDGKSLTATEKGKRAMQDLFGDDLLETQGDIFSPEGVVEFRGEQVSIASLATPPSLLVQKITWE
ncbi:uncharacterized protein F5891DRAFT_987771 [Suillus fuscotomentosus]|uniref:Uncharacterized protein n=1 Tax=Suillus fuscotomentosus TaxID=1912939 RepID=A0AAD4HCK2_9AGAM|nr:uncharacterized protein F5891DRAFT_987771 [Suillus fuscotomentosus]KAG1888479.1 hypothetical protein F5891DRAFT_987771 [Suillus fuscotomentosus]